VGRKCARILVAVDLSAIIFVVLAVAWAVYLIPKALKHHDEMASDRLVEGHSDKVRILSRKSPTAQPGVVEVEVEHIDTSEKTTNAKPAAPRPVVTRSAARKAAQRRRRVLGVLVLALAVVWGLTLFAYLPIWAPAIPGGMVTLFLVVARLSVRNGHSRRRTAVARTVVEPVETTTGTGAESLVDRLTEGDSAGAQRQEIEAALAEEGSLWDPLPMTLPTYVNKARARRTVRTIELTGINSSGHDVADTALAREAGESAQKSDQTTKDAEAGQRKVAGA
jgi:hypothetical protein